MCALPQLLLFCRQLATAALTAVKLIEGKGHQAVASAGWPSVDAYYEGSSSALSVPHITIPMLCIQVGIDALKSATAAPQLMLSAVLHTATNCLRCPPPSSYPRVVGCEQAVDDPIAPEAAIPYAALAANDKCILAVTPTGGHLGWVNPSDILGAPSVHTGVVEFFSAVLARQERPVAKAPATEGRPIAA